MNTVEFDKLVRAYRAAVVAYETYSIKETEIEENNAYIALINAFMNWEDKKSSLERN